MFGGGPCRSAFLAGLCMVTMACVCVAQDRMVWVQASNSSALCNDYTRAGFFIRRNASSDRWVIFLESGSLCYSNETCNRRFFNSESRNTQCGSTPARRTASSMESPFGNFDPAAVYSCLLSRGQKYAEFVNPLMTSMQCLNRDLFGENFSVQGTDLLDANQENNQDFYSHNHILIPYCSSDIWLASEIRSDQPRECNCSDVECFNYRPDSLNLQFAFRGKIIFQSIFQQLMTNHGMDGASEILLGGSSAGGLGVVNLVQWVQVEKPPSAELLVLMDSSWFINFQDGILRTFDGTVSENPEQPSRPVQEADGGNRLFSILSSHTSCTDQELGYPCCLSAHCVLTAQDNMTGQLKHFPQSKVRTFLLGSVYDVFLLAPAVVGLDDFASVSGGDSVNTTSLLIDFLRVVGEYGGEMNFTLAQAFNDRASSVSYYLTQCFQHVYFATSSLWGRRGTSVFGNSAVELARDLISFSHTIEPGRWNSPLSASGTTAREAISDWYNNRTDRRFLDSCQGPYCNENCPDRFTLGNLTSNNWPVWAKVLIAGSLISIAILCLLMKMLFNLWLYRLEKKQDDYLDSLDQIGTEDAELVFPHCPDTRQVAVSCLDLTYNVSFKTNKNVKDERKDQTQAVVLQELTQEEPEKEAPSDDHSKKSKLRRRSRFTSSLAETLFKRASTAGTPVNTDPEMNIAGSIPTAPPPPPLPIIAPVAEDVAYNSCGCQTKRVKEILRGISIYFNPGEMIGIMGPSGCGKTTLLDLLTGRRTGGVGGNIYVNGIPMEEIRDWYIANTGYVLQLATPYYEELTVRDNLTLSAQIKLPESDNFTYKDKFKRVEQVMEVTGLSSLADTVVGGEIGPGLSGGQKRRLVVALQLLKVPSVIFLDEPTSGLDATSSMELLSHLNRLAETNRTVILTIHQPRFEIFHMFHKLVLISDGRVAYHGRPEKAYEVFVSALRDRYLEQGLIIPSLGDHNPADVIMDMLGNPRFRLVLTEYYQESREPKLVRYAVKVARWREYSQSSSSVDSIGSAFEFALFGAKKVGQRHAHTFTRMAALEARGSKRISLSKNFFLPFMFFAFAIVLGTVYFQQTRAFLVVSGMCVFSVASGLFVFPAIEVYYTPAIRVYLYERADGVGRSQDLVIQGFIRYITVAFLPVIVSTAIIYLLLINRSEYNFLVFLQVSVVNVALNLTWTALLISLMLALPKTAFRLSSAIASVFGFTSGFFIPINQIPWWYRWIAYINPNYYGFSSVAFFLLENFTSGCVGSDLECYFSSGAFTLRQFFFDNINPYLHLLILLMFTFFFLGLAMAVNWARHTSVLSKMRRLIAVIFRRPSDSLSAEIKSDRAGFERSISTAASLDEEGLGNLDDDVELGFEELSPDPERHDLDPIVEEEEVGVEEEATAGAGTQSGVAIRGKWKNVAERSLETAPANGSSVEESITSTGSGWNRVKMVRIQDDQKRPQKLDLKQQRRKSYRTPFLRDGEAHMVWRPKKRPQLANLVELLKSNESVTSPPAKPEQPATPKVMKSIASLLTPSASRTPSLQSRQKTLFNRVIATQAVLKEHTDELLQEEDKKEETKPRMTLLEASKKVSASLKQQKSGDEGSKNFSDIVSQFLTKAKSEGEETKESRPAPGDSGSGVVGGSKWGAVKNKKPQLVKRETRGAISIQALRELVREEKLRSDDSSKRHSTGGVAFGTSSPSGGRTLSPADGSATPQDPPKLGKMAKLKKDVTERRQYKQSLTQETTPSGSVAGGNAASLNTNYNNSQGGVHLPSIVEEDVGRVRRIIFSDSDLSRPKSSHFVGSGGLSPSDDSRSGERGASAGGHGSKPGRRRRRKSEDVATDHVTIKKERRESTPAGDDVI